MTVDPQDMIRGLKRELKSSATPEVNKAEILAELERLGEPMRVDGASKRTPTKAVRAKAKD